MAAGASQCGFCTPGDRHAPGRARPRRRPPPDRGTRSRRRCWPTCAGAPAGRPSSRRRATCLGGTAAGAGGARSGRDPLLAAWRAQLEGPAFQTSGTRRRAGRRRASPTTRRPPARWWRCPTRPGGCVVAPEPGRRPGPRRPRCRAAALDRCRSRHPLEVPEGDWALTLRTTWVEPAYLEPDASWCAPGGEPASPLANGGAFGGKRRSPVPADARRAGRRHGGPVRVLWSREDVVRRGPKRPPVAAGHPRGRHRGAAGGPAPPAAGGPRRGLVGRVAAVAPGLAVEEVDGGRARRSRPTCGAPGGPRPRCSAAAVGAASRRRRRPGRAGRGGRPARRPGPGRPWRRAARWPCEVWAGEVLDAVDAALLLHRGGAPGARLGAAARASRWTTAATVHDLTIRSFGILPARRHAAGGGDGARRRPRGR